MVLPAPVGVVGQVNAITAGVGVADTTVAVAVGLGVAVAAFAESVADWPMPHPATNSKLVMIAAIRPQLPRLNIYLALPWFPIKLFALQHPKSGAL